MPKELAALKQYASSKPDAVFVLKNNGHRGIRIVDAEDPQLAAAEGVFAQVQNI
jgi:hypothetical protein